MPDPAPTQPSALKRILPLLLLATLALCAIWYFYPTPPPIPPYELIEAPNRDPEAGFAISPKTQPAKGTLHALVIYAQFRDEAHVAVPDSARHLFDADLPGSLTHFYNTMSFGQLQLSGRVLPRRYVSDKPRSAYLSHVKGEDGRYGEFAVEILKKAEADIDFGEFDNDGPDGVPNSGDDDGIVDYLFICLVSTPKNFIRGGATGIAGLAFLPDYQSQDTTANGEPLIITGGMDRSAIFQGGTFAQTVGVMAHEFGHALGLPDLYDLYYRGGEDDSAGIGRWGLMGWGALGWHGHDGPTPLSPRSREHLGWIGPDNEYLVEIDDETHDLRIADLHQGGRIYKVPVHTYLLQTNLYQFYEQEYLLLEQRTKDSHYYNRTMPGEGLLVWHIRPHAFRAQPYGANADERRKIVDLICADGLYADGGHGKGQRPDPLHGRDNLDFWAHDASYANAHAGNKGDATDLFDGLRFTSYNAATNPSTNIEQRRPPDAATSVTLSRIQRDGDAMRVDISVPHWSGTIREQVHWIGPVLVEGELTIAPEGELIIYNHSWVRFAEGARLQVEGKLRVEELKFLFHINDKGKQVLVKKQGIAFDPLDPDTRWAGIHLGPEAQITGPDESIVLTAADHSPRHPLFLKTATTHISTADQIQVPEQVEVYPNKPNPFSGETRIPYALPRFASVQVEIYNALGQLVRRLDEGMRAVGEHEAIWDGRDETARNVASGVYLSRLLVNQQAVQGPKMAVQR